MHLWKKTYFFPVGSYFLHPEETPRASFTQISYPYSKFSGVSSLFFQPQERPVTLGVMFQPGRTVQKIHHLVCDVRERNISAELWLSISGMWIIMSFAQRLEGLNTSEAIVIAYPPLYPLTAIISLWPITAPARVTGRIKSTRRSIFRSRAVSAVLLCRDNASKCWRQVRGFWQNGCDDTRISSPTAIASSQLIEPQLCPDIGQPWAACRGWCLTSLGQSWLLVIFISDLVRGGCVISF